MKLLIIGAQGFLGSRFLSYREHYESLGMEFIGLGSKFNNIEEIAEFDFQKYDVIVNCAAFTNMDECESNPYQAFWVNSKLPGELAKVVKGTQTKLVHISTDAVFDGSSEYSLEGDPPSPISLYGLSKSIGEDLVLQSGDANLVCRVNFVGPSPKGNSLFDYFYSKLAIKEKVRGYTNIYFTPLYVDDVVHGVITLIQFKETGIFHLVGDEKISKYDFGRMIESVFFKDLNCVSPEPFVQNPSLARRGLDLSLSNSKVKSLGIVFPELRERMIQLLPQLKEG